MSEWDIYIPTFFEMLNLRFAPPQGSEPHWVGGITEVAALQTEFQVFQTGRSFSRSAALLGLGGQLSPQAKQRWLSLLADLETYPSNIGGLNGDQAIVSALLENFAGDVKPVYFQAHDSRVDGERRVVIEASARPMFYIEIDYVTVSIPMRPRRPT